MAKAFHTRVFEDFSFKGMPAGFDNDALVRVIRRAPAAARRLGGLAGQRDKLTERIMQAKQFAAETADRARTLDLSGVAGSPEGLQQGLDVHLAQLRRFRADVARLAKRGLHKGLLRQLIEGGPEQSGALASSLAQADRTTLRRLTNTQIAVDKAAKGLGRTSADALYDAGTKAARGFLTGLKAQEKALQASMRRIAEGLAAAIRRALKIHSPSRVTMEIGRQVGRGLALGLVQSHRQVAGAARSMASAAIPGRGPAGGGAGFSQQVTIVQRPGEDPRALADRMSFATRHRLATTGAA
jgi:hypothetical protein